MIPENIIDEIKLKVNIVDVISEVTDLSKFGSNYKSCCPFLDHKDKTPSFSVSESKQIYKCFGCQRSGNVFTFLIDYHGYTFIEAVKYLADQVGVVIPYQGRTESDLIEQIHDVLNKYVAIGQDVYGRDGLDYFQSRGLSKEIIERFNLGFDGASLSVKDMMGVEANSLAIEESGVVSVYNFNVKNKFADRYLFPIHDHNGKVVSIGGTNKKAEPKYLNGPDTKVYSKSNVLYGLHLAKNSIKDKGYAILVEGYMDCLQMVNHKFENTVASCGTSVTFQQAKLLSRHTKSVILFFDGDEAGRKAVDKTFVIMFDQDIDLFVIETPEKEDPDSLVFHHWDQVNDLLKSASLWFDLKLKRTVSLSARKDQIQLVKELAKDFENDDRRLLFLDLSAQKLGVDVRMFSGSGGRKTTTSSTDMMKLVTEFPDQVLLLASSMFNDKAKGIRDNFTVPEFGILYGTIMKAKDVSSLFHNLDSELAPLMWHVHGIYVRGVSFKENLFLVQTALLSHEIKIATQELYSAERSITDTTKLVNEVNRLIKLKQELVKENVNDYETTIVPSV